MLSLLLCAQIAGALASDSTYTTPALRALVSRAAIENLRPPSEFRAYKSRIETELSLLIRDSLGREHTASVEQIGFVSPQHGNYRLATSSSYRHAGPDGREPGADLDAIARFAAVPETKTR